MKRVFVTGLGVVSPIGIGVDNFVEGLRQGKSGVSSIAGFDASKHTVQIAGEIKNFDPEQYMQNKKEIRRNDRYSQFAMSAAAMAVAQAGLLEKNYDPFRVGVTVSTGIGGIHTFESEYDTCLAGGPSRVSPFLVPMMICNISAGCIAMEYGFNGPNYCIVSACASGLHGIGEAFLKIVHDECDIMVCGGAEAAITPLTVAGFAKMKALSTRNDAPEKASRPFDKDRDGFVMGEGAGVLVIESEESARRRGARVLAEVRGYGATADAYHLTAPHPEGEGGFRAMTKAINFSNFPVERVNYVNAHGTSTPLGDVAEMKAVRRVFADKMSSVSINATKSMIGHLLGAAGAVGSVATVLQIQHGFIHPTINLDNIDPELSDLDLTPNVAREKQIDGGIVNSFGFGGQNASVLFSKPE
ncbi:MAG: beta-ketoacyl-[acyl-carrier-protein] synthase II [Candidatus Riflebacteria bacterium HGW-Riflebacteria-1]|jgi:3-oxoacyl-[acyl-carrier-protein] synthase II|nr:MAG: beta-ketoacyl-[acyl-carrier-protein] synthase II [Candidatus Riflebacteria bacterium HGW-Riflebacteria-1]